MKKITAILICISMLILPFALNATAEAEPNLILSFDFDESNFVDGVSNTAAVTKEAKNEAPATYTDGKFGKALVLKSDVQTNASISTDALNDLTAFTVSFWYKGDGMPHHPRGRIWEFMTKQFGDENGVWFTATAKGNASDNDSTFAHFMQSSVAAVTEHGTVYPGFTTKAAVQNSVKTVVQKTIPLGEWHYYTITYQNVGDKATIKVYVDKDLIVTETDYYLISDFSPDTMTFGQSRGNPLSVAGTLDQFYMFDGVISQAMMNRLYSTGYPTESSGSTCPDITVSISDEAGGDKIDHLYLNAVISASETRDVGIIFSDTEASCEYGANPLFIRVAEEGHGRSASGFIQSGCYGSHVITAVNLDGEEGDSVLAVYWQDMPTSYGTLYARTFAKNSDGTYEYGAIATITLTDGASVLPLEE